MSRPVGITSRRLLAASWLLALFVLLDIGLFGWLLIRSMSQREIERVLLETREEAESLAQELAGRAAEQGDLYTAIALERETQTYIDSVLKQRDVVQTVQVLDKEGRLVFRGRTEVVFPMDPPDSPPGEVQGGQPEIEQKTFERESTYDYDLEVPIGDLGFLRIGISRSEMEKRIAVLQADLVNKTGMVGGLTMLVLALANGIIWWLWKRGRQLEEQAAESERMAYVGTLASGLAHEIRNPLNSLSLNMQLLEEEMGEELRSESSRKILGITQREIGRLERLVSDFLGYARPRRLELERLAAGEVLDSCREILEGELERRGAILEVEDLSDGAEVLVDAHQLSQVLINLVQNGLAAAEDSGRPPVLALRALRNGGDLVFEVEDNGIGIPPEDRQRIFELFFSTKKGGTGLGLPIVDRIARAHRGSVAVESDPGSGTTVRVSLPLAVPGGAFGPSRA